MKIFWLVVLTICCPFALKSFGGTVGYWKFDESSGSSILDSSGNGRNLVLGNTSSGSVGDPSRVQGYSNKGLLFSSDFDEVYGDVVKFDPSVEPAYAPLTAPGVDSSWTIEAFIKLNSIPPPSSNTDLAPYIVFQWLGRMYDDQDRLINDGIEGELRIIRFTDTSAKLQVEYYTGLPDNPVVRSDYTPNPNSLVTPVFYEGLQDMLLVHPTELVVGRWYYISASYDAQEGTRSLQVDAAEISGLAVPMDLEESVMRLNIGAGSWANIEDDQGFWRPFDGVIDEVRISDTVLSDPNKLFNTLDHQPVVAYWKFDETTGQYIQDSSGSGHDMVIGNAGGSDTLADPTRTANGYSNGALSFSSEDIGNVVQFENADEPTQVPTVTPTSTMSWTVEAFFKLSAIPDNWGTGDSPNTLLQWEDTAGRVNLLRVRRQTVDSVNYGQMDATYWDGSNYQTLLHDALLEIETWYYVAMTYDVATGTRKLWIDDVSTNDTPGAVNLGTPKRFSIGSGSWTGSEFNRSFDGMIDEVRISNYLVQGNDMLLNSLFRPDKNANWNFDETSGQLVLDSSGNGYDMFLGSSPLDTTGDPSRTSNGYNNGALIFDNNSTGDIIMLNPFVDAEVISAITPTSSMDWMIKFMFKLNSIPDSWGSGQSPNTLLEWKDSSGRVCILRLRRQTVDSVNYGQLDSTYWGGRFYEVLLHPALLEVDTWYSVATSFEYRTNQRTLWIDDVNLSVIANPVILESPESFVIGSASGFNRSFDGVIDEVRITDLSTVIEYIPLSGYSVPTGFLLQWNSITGRSYCMEGSTNMLDNPAFTVLQSNIPVEAATTEFIDTNANGKVQSFYRVYME